MSDARRPTILVADDLDLLHGAYRLALEGAGFEVLTVSSGAEALAVYQQRGREIDIVLLDVHMPGMSGPATLRELRKRNPDIICFFLTGASWDLDRETVWGANVVGVFRKPADVTSMGKVLRHLLDPAPISPPD